MCNSINIGLSPNLKKNDSLLAFKLLFQPWRWKKGKEVAKLENWFKNYLGVKYTIAFNSGRSAEYAILKSLGIKKDDEVLIQAFTCVAVPNSILWTGAKPIFVDIEQSSFNMNTADLEKKITARARAIIVQHTFGIPAKINEILNMGKRHNLYVVEDCAHIIKKDIVVDAAFFSFGRDKAVSSVFGGMAATNDERLGKKLKEFQEKLEYPSYFWIFQQLLHPVVSSIILPLYNVFGIGKIILFILQRLRLLSFPVYQEEKISKRPSVFPTKIPNVLAILAINQLKNLEEFERKRVKLAENYEEKLKGLPIKLPTNTNLPFLRYPILTEKAEELRVFAKRQGIILGDWYSHIVDPKGVNLEKIGYKMGSCSVAEKTARQVVNLPTYSRMSLADAQKVVDLIYEFHKRNN